MIGLSEEFMSRVFGDCEIARWGGSCEIATYHFCHHHSHLCHIILIVVIFVFIVIFVKVWSVPSLPYNAAIMIIRIKTVMNVKLWSELSGKCVGNCLGFG